MKAAALNLAANGFKVFPLWQPLKALHKSGYICACGKTDCGSPAKHPIGNLAPRGCLDATRDAARVKWFWECAPGANIGVATGDCLAVLDIDPRHGGNEALIELQRRFGNLPITLAVRTGGGGSHLFFETDRDMANSAGALGAGLDIRGAGGYVVAPPGVHITGARYEWEAGFDPAFIAPAPDWLHQAAVVQPRAKLRLVVGCGVQAGARNETIARLTGKLLRGYVNPHLVLDLMLAWNAVRCKPPLGDGEVETIVNSICGRELRRRRAL